MKTSIASLSAAALLAIAAPLLHAQTPVRVTADHVNLRAKAIPTSEVVGQVNYDDRLVARQIGEEWVEVAAPPSVDLWVTKSYVQFPQHTIGSQRVNLRAGPGIAYNIVDTLSLGDKIEPRGEEMQDWLKVAPPPSTHVWIHRDFIEILSGDAPPAPAESPSSASAPETTPAASGDHPQPADKPSKKRKHKEKAELPALPESPAPAADSPIPTPLVSPSIPEKDAIVRDDSALREIPVPPPADLKLIPLEGQGRLTEVEGELRAAPLINEAPTRYRVVRWQNNRWQILCHVYGDASKFRNLQDKRVRLKGREYWIQGAAAPVLIPDQIQEIPPVE